MKQRQDLIASPEPNLIGHILNAPMTASLEGVTADIAERKKALQKGGLLGGT